ncbi:uncharacterized protein LOC130648275, partial [Hydractinia symbiolongicarpus]|uniref:uncharacterized protein LOC130648275 n=1 Tax=Hydractinia symbiolongicarpus TaxID=13093 RepID=UPI00254B0C51
WRTRTVPNRAGYFDKSEAADKYSDFFVHKEESLLEGTILSVHKTSVRVKFLIDESVSTIKFEHIVAITDQEFEKGRKRKRNEEDWEKNRKKQKRNFGQSYSPYISYTNRKSNTQARSIGEPCHNWRLNCSNKISVDRRKNFFCSYWNLGNLDKQRQFLLNSIVIEAPSRHRPRKEVGENRSNSIKYFLNVQQVCQPMFLETFGASRKTVRTAIFLKKDGNLVSEDRREKGNLV